MDTAVNGHLMSRDAEVAVLRDGMVEPMVDALLPLYFRQESATLDEWLKMRSIDTGRANSRLLRKSLGLSDASTEELVLSVNAAMITDTYWIRPEGSTLAWADIRFEQNSYASMSLLGSFSDFNQPGSRTPELTSPGSFEKCWRLEDGRWWLYKLSDLDNLYSELAAYQLCRHFGYATAHYEAADISAHGFIGKLKPGRGVIRTLDFTDGASVNFEPAAAIGLKSDDSAYNYKTLLAMAPALAAEYLDIVTMDTLIYNLDRHTQNFGILRDVDTGTILSMAPNFDNNLALLAGIRGMTTRTPESDRLFQGWKQLVQSNLLEISLPLLDEQTLRGILFGIEGIVDEGGKQIAFDFIRQGYAMMQEVAQQMERFHHPGGTAMQMP
ncbi:hypothetical protein LJC64_04875 [Ruminococcaceae bacterium OttesenSCG-928-A11]|nr:hypothetical protein [Ruminococcaceae bacterium OttesenSCG-928-A11]